MTASCQTSSHPRVSLNLNESTPLILDIYQTILICPMCTHRTPISTPQYHMGIPHPNKDAPSPNPHSSDATARLDPASVPHAYLFHPAVRPWLDAMVRRTIDGKCFNAE